MHVLSQFGNIWHRGCQPRKGRKNSDSGLIGSSDWFLLVVASAAESNAFESRITTASCATFITRSASRKVCAASKAALRLEAGRGILEIKTKVTCFSLLLP